MIWTLHLSAVDLDNWQMEGHWMGLCPSQFHALHRSTEICAKSNCCDFALHAVCGSLFVSAILKKSAHDHRIVCGQAAESVRPA